MEAGPESVASVSAGLPVQVGFAVKHAWPGSKEPAERTTQKGKVSFGLSSGHVIDGVEKPQDLSGHHCGHVVELACAVGPGFAGAPVVDERMAVRGFIVGGKADLKNPWAAMFPAFRWGRKLAQKAYQRG